MGMPDVTHIEQYSATGPWKPGRDTKKLNTAEEKPGRGSQDETREGSCPHAFFKGCHQGMVATYLV